MLLSTVSADEPCCWRMPPAPVVAEVVLGQHPRAAAVEVDAVADVARGADVVDVIAAIAEPA